MASLGFLSVGLDDNDIAYLYVKVLILGDLWVFFLFFVRMSVFVLVS